jgi:hypothetical protein
VSDSLEVPALEPADVAEAPDLIEAIVAFRKWRVVDGRLRSLYEPIFWLEPMQEAECRSGRYQERLHGSRRGQQHNAPQAGCSCGIYASHEPDYRFPTVDYRGVSGIVTAWGAIEVHADGLRAEFVQVEALSMYSHWGRRQSDAVRTVAETLEVDLVDLYDLEAVAGRYGARLDRRLVEIDH